MGLCQSKRVGKEYAEGFDADCDARVAQSERNVRDLLETLAEHTEARRVAEEACQAAKDALSVAEATVGGVTVDRDELLAHISSMTEATGSHAMPIAELTRCPICWEDKSDSKSVMNCGHTVCASCYEKLVYKKCGICRSEAPNLIRLHDSYLPPYTPAN
jgi:hypothetical protein